MLPSNELTSVAFIASKKFSKKAVDRNRAKRLLKEAYRLLQYELKKKFYLSFIARNKIKYAAMPEIKNELKKIFNNQSVFQ